MKISLLLKSFFAGLLSLATAAAASAAATTTSVSSSPDPSVFGQPVTFTANVMVVPPDTGTPTGTVTFVYSDGGPSITVPLDGAGQAQAVVSDLSAGNRQVVGVYDGDGTFDPSSSPLDSHTVHAGATTTTVSATPNPSSYGQTVTVTATITADAPSVGTPTGTVTFSGPGLIQSIELDSTGSASATVSTLESGTITATYSGTDGFSESAGSVVITVNAAATTTALSASTNPSVYGESVEITATVSSNGGTPTGTVTFVGHGINQTVALVQGVASLTTTELASGTITATYNGDGGSATSSGTLELSVNPAATTTTVTSAPNPSVYGETVTVAATVTTTAPGSGTPTGTVTFTGPGGLNQTVALDSIGIAALTSTTLTTGTITATYNGDAGHSGSTGTGMVTVNPASTTTSVTADPHVLVYGQAVEVSAIVTTNAPGSGTPMGTVTFTGPGGLNTTVAVDGQGQAAIATTVIETGTITATYNGGAVQSGSSGTVSVTAEPASTVTSVTASPDPSVTGEAVTVSATVTTNAPGSGTPTGTVTFTGPGGLNTTATVDGQGQAAITTTVLTTGTITATYNGDAGRSGSSGTRLVAVMPASTTTSVTADSDSSVTGELVTVSATVTTTAPGSGTPTGTVTFTGPGGLNQTVTLDMIGEAVLTTTSLHTGTITATYNGDAAYDSSTGTASVTVSPAATTTTVVIEPSVYGENVEIVAAITVDEPGSGIPTGTVTFTDGQDLNVTVDLDEDGLAVFDTNNLNTGDTTITATYNGSESYSGSTGTATATVDQHTTTVTIEATPEAITYGQSVTLMATVSSEIMHGILSTVDTTNINSLMSSNTITTYDWVANTPTGTVTFMDGTTVLGTVALDHAHLTSTIVLTTAPVDEGHATLTTSSLSGGTRNITAVYSGDVNFATATSDPAVVVVAPASQTILFGALENLIMGGSITLSGSASSGLPVSFSVVSGPATIVGKTLTTTGVGSVTVRASQSGNGNYSAASDVTRSFTVTIGEATVTTPGEVPTPPAGGTAELSVIDPNPNLNYQWQRNGAALSSASGTSLSLQDVQPATAGLYTYTATVNGGGSATSNPVIVGVTTTEKVIGTGEEVGADIIHPNGNTYDQVLLEGNGATITSNPNQITRVSFVDLTNDIVQVEFSGAGTLSVVMDDASTPAPAANYNQADVDYVKGHVGLVITGANETSNISVISVGPVTAVNQGLFKDDVSYDGVANIAFIAIQSTNGKFGGIRTGNVNFFASTGFTGIYAPGVQITGPVNIGDVSAFDSASPVLVLGAASTVNITGGSLQQENGRSISTSGIGELKFVDGTTSQGVVIPAQANEAQLTEEGVDVSDLIVVNP